MPYRDPEKQRQWHANRRAALKAAHMCVTCKGPTTGECRCDGCRKKHRERQNFYDRFHKRKRVFSKEELYKRAKSEREVVSWCWKNPA